MQVFRTLPEWVKLEHEVAKLLTKQELHGWYFDEQAAWKLASSLRVELEETHRLLRQRHPFIRGSEFTPKRDNKTSGYIKGATFTRQVQFNPTSRDHIAWILKHHYDWQPKTMTNTGKAAIDEVVLKTIDLPFATMCLKSLDLTKTLGMISEGVNAWLKLVTATSRIHHHCSVATATSRCAHRSPNLGQVKSDPRCRALFLPSPGQVMVAADLSGVELRMLAHYLARFDNGRYANILLNDDIHQINADKIGISRKQVKTVTYGFLYGQGAAGIGASFDDTLSPEKAKVKGQAISKAFIEAIPGLGDLLKAVKGKVEQHGYVRAIDGRKIPVDKPFKGLNYLLQSSSAILAKRWMLINQQHINELKLSCNQLAFIHDELQFECQPGDAKDLASSLVLSSTEAGEYYGLRCRIDAEAKQGSNWAETH